MEMDNTYNIIRIQQYLRGELTPEEMNQLERQALDDPFLSDAIEGYAHKGVSHAKLTLLQQRLQDRIAQQPQERSRMLFNSQRLGIAAVACLLFLLSCVLFWMINTRDAKTGQEKVTLELKTSEPIPSGNGLSIARKLTDKSAAPEIGWEAFNSYVKKNMRAANIGKDVVILSFEINEHGRPINISSSKGKSASVKEVKMLLENGPIWTGNKRADVEFVFE